MFKLKEFRESKEIYQSEMAHILNMTQSSISRIESGSSKLTPSQMKLLIDRFGKEDVEAFIVDDPIIHNHSAANINNGKNQYNGISTDKDLVEIIKKQNITLCEQLEKSNSMNERLISLLEKITMR